MSWNKRVAARMQEQAKAMDQAGNKMIRISLGWWVLTAIIILAFFVL